jgi:septal ring factor EnvC (AmiA/AmiB activator)
MYTQSFSQNTGGSDQDKSRSRADIQREIVMQESDLHKKQAEKVRFEAEIRALKKDEARIRVALQEKQEKFSKMGYDILQMENAIKALKKKLYTIK